MMKARLLQGLAIVALLSFFLALYTQSIVLLIVAIILMIVPVGRNLMTRLKDGEIMKVLLIFFILGFAAYIVFMVFDF